MDTIWTFLNMGGYAAFIWPAVGIVAGGMALLLVQSLRALRQRERLLASLTQSAPEEALSRDET